MPVVSGVTLPDGKLQKFTYDTLHRPKVITYNAQTITTNTYTGIVQNKATYGNSKVTNYTYDTINRPLTINAGTTIPLPTYTYNDSSDILSDGTKSYTYD